MSGQVPGVADVRARLRSLLGTSVHPVGSRLPSCRELADELGSNPSTVNRALRSLAAEGIVRTVPRRGSFVIGPGHAVATVDDLAVRVAERLREARRAGLAVEEIERAVALALEQVRHRPRVALVECNPVDGERMAALVANASGLEVAHLTFDELDGRYADDLYDVVVVPLFHLSDVATSVRDLDNVVDLHFVASDKVLRQLATLPLDGKVAAAAPTARGAERMVGLVRQYFAGEVVPFRVGTDGPDALAGVQTVVRNNAAELTPELARAVQRVVPVEWGLEPGFVRGFHARVDDVARRRAAAVMAVAG